MGWRDISSSFPCEDRIWLGVLPISKEILQLFEGSCVIYSPPDSSPRCWAKESLVSRHSATEGETVLSRKYLYGAAVSKFATSRPSGHFSFQKWRLLKLLLNIFSIGEYFLTFPLNLVVGELSLMACVMSASFSPVICEAPKSKNKGDRDERKWGSIHTLSHTPLLFPVIQLWAHVHPPQQDDFNFLYVGVMSDIDETA